MKVEQIFRYPLKSGAAQALSQTDVNPLGLVGDRVWILTDPQGRFVTARECPLMGQIQVQGSRFSLGDDLSPLAELGPAQPLSIWNRTQQGRRACDEVNAWFSQVLNLEAVLWHLQVDDQQHYGDSQPVMVLFQATAQAIEQALGRPFAALQLRPNVVLSGGEAFSEGQLGNLILGSAELGPIEPCTRCKMINLTPESGAYDRFDVAPALRQLSPDFVAGHHFCVRTPGLVSVGDTRQ